MKSNLICKLSGVIIMLFLLSPVTFAQDRNAVVQAFNEGAKLTQTDAPAAIKALENVIVLADKVGESAADLKQKAIGALPGLYSKVASAAITNKKPVSEIMSSAKAAVSSAEKYGTAAQKETASKILVQAYTAQASGFFSSNDYASALVTFDSILSISPDNTNAMYNKAYIFSKQNNSASFEQAIDQYLAKVKTANDEASVKKGSTLALGYFRSAASKANQENKLDDALPLLDKAAKYGDDKDLFYYFSDVYNKKKNFDKGAEYAKRGLDLETGTADAKAKFYFQLGVAQAGKGQNAEACGSFKNSVYGAFADASKIQLKNLKCQ
jgi:tetratricopeptide (TPR) repeat protein